MKLTKLYKDPGSGNGGCPTVYLGDTGELVVQGDQLDSETLAELENVLPGETAVRIAPEIVLGAVERYHIGAVQTERLYALGDEFARLFRTFKHTAFRLETLQKYTVEYEREPIRRFLAGEPQSEDPSKDEWCDLIRDARAQGKRMERVHVVVEPLSDYLRYEIGWSYGPNVEAGEDIRIAPAPAGAWIEDLPQNYDFWLFDSQDLWVMAYGDEGEFLYAEHVKDPAAVVRHNHMRDVAMHTAMGFRDYMRRHPDLGL